MTVSSRKAWEIREQDFPRWLSITEQLRFLLQYAILAPSARNSQPWQFALEDRTVHLLADLTRIQPVADPHARELYMSLGCALENLLVAAEHFGLEHEVNVFPQHDNEEPVASIAFAPGGTRSAVRKTIPLRTILRRSSDSRSYRPTLIDDHQWGRLKQCCIENDLRLDLIEDWPTRQCIEVLMTEADLQTFASREFRRELASSVGAGVFGTSRSISRLGRQVLSRLDLGRAIARQDRAFLDSAASVGFISSREDNHVAHLRTGQLLERLWLTATALGLNIQPMSRTMQVPEIRAHVARLFPKRAWIPQQLFRVGASRSGGWRRSPRRPLEAVLVS
jgi:nitroreductase